MNDASRDRPYDAVIFDLDGTLVESAGAIRAAMLTVCDAMELPHPDLAQVKGFVGGGVSVAMARLLDWAGADRTLRPRAVELMHAAYAEVDATKNEVLPGAKDALAWLAAQGIPAGLCTNKPEGPTRAILEGLSLGPFAAVVTADDVPVLKPDPSPLNACCARLRAMPSRCLFVGDSEIDHAAATGARMPFALVEGGYLNAPLRGPAPAHRLAGVGTLIDVLT